MKPNPSLPLYDMLADEAIEALVEDKELMDTDDYLSFEMLKAYRICRMFFGDELPKTKP